MAEINKFSGVRNDVTAERFSSSDLEIANNVDIDNSGKLLMRGGFLKKVTGAYHSLWSDGVICLFVTGTQLRQLMTDLTNSIVIRSDLTAGLRMVYEVVNGQVYYSNGTQSGIFSSSGNRTWGIVPPVFQPLAQGAAGDLPAGTYQYALTYVRNDGQESGTGLADQIELTSGAIDFYDIPVSPDPSVTHKILYVSTQNGEVLYRAVVMSNETTSLVYNGADLRTPLETQFKQQAPAGQVIGYFSGFMYAGYANYLHYSDAYGYELFDLRDYLPFDGTLTMFAPVKDGVYIGTDKATYFCVGRNPKEMVLNKIAPYGVVAGTLCYVASDKVAGLEKIERENVPMWTAQQGICVGASGGFFSNMTQSRYTFDAATIGAALCRKQEGSDQYLSILQN